MDDAVTSNSFASQAELTALAVVVLGFIVARLTSAGLGRTMAALDRRVARMTTTDSSVFSPRLIRLSRAFAFWIVLMLAFALALRLLGLGGVSSLSDAVITFIPQALVGIAIIAVGHLLGLLASSLLVELNRNIPADSIVPRLLYGAIVTVAVVMGLQHVAVDISFVTQLLLLLVAIAGSGLVLAFALGSRRYVANLLAHKELARLTTGERIRVDGEEGKIVEIHGTGVDIATKEGIVSIPAARFVEANVLHVGEDALDE